MYLVNNPEEINLSVDIVKRYRPTYPNLLALMLITLKEGNNL